MSSTICPGLKVQQDGAGCHWTEQYQVHKTEGESASSGNVSQFSLLRRAVMGELDIRRTNLDGVKIDYEQVSSLMADLGITVTE